MQWELYQSSTPTEAYFTAVKQILCYLKGTINLGLVYKKSSDSNLYGYSDAVWAGDIDSCHSTTGNAFVISGAAFSWLSKKQPVVALSITEAEYIALLTAAQEATWLRRLLTDIKTPPVRSTVIKEDNQSAIAIAKNLVSHARTKHIDVKIHFVREALSNGSIELIYYATEQMVADLLTKPISCDRFEALRPGMGLSY